MIAAEDFTGPWVLNVQSCAKELGSVPLAIPHRAGDPRNIGQLSLLAPGAAASDPFGSSRPSSRQQALNEYAVFIALTTCFGQVTANFSALDQAAFALSDATSAFATE